MNFDECGNVYLGLVGLPNILNFGPKALQKFEARSNKVCFAHFLELGVKHHETGLLDYGAVGVILWHTCVKLDLHCVIWLCKFLDQIGLTFQGQNEQFYSIFYGKLGKLVYQKLYLGHFEVLNANNKEVLASLGHLTSEQKVLKLAEIGLFSAEKHFLRV